MTNNAVRQPEERERALAAVDMRIQGHTYAQIAAQLGFADESGARHAVSRTLDRREADGIGELRAVHSARLETVLSSFWPGVQRGDAEAARVVLRTLDSLAKLFGLDAPTRVAVGTPMSNTEFAIEAAQLIERITSLGGTDELLRSLPNGVGHAALAARQTAALPEAVAVVPPDDADWSNIGGPEPVPVAVVAGQPDADADALDGIPAEVLELMAAASDDDAALTILDDYRKATP